MSASAEHGDLSRNRRHPDRRTFAAGLAGWGLSAVALHAAGPAFALQPDQALPPTPPPLPLPPDEELRLLTNLMTRLATPASVNGRDAGRFVLDTGAERTAIADDVAAAMALPPGPPVMVHGVTAAEEVATVRIARLAFGGAVFRDIVAPVFPRPLLAADGLLGLDVLSRFALAFDLARSSANLSLVDADGVRLHRSGAASRRVRRSGRGRAGHGGQIMLVDTLAEGRPVEAFIDSGAQYSIGNMALHDAVGPFGDAGLGGPLQVPIYGVTGQMLLARPGALRELEIDGKRLGPTPMLFADLYAFRKLDMVDRPALLIGADVLYRFRTITLDFARSSVDFSGLRRRPPVIAG